MAHQIYVGFKICPRIKDFGTNIQFRTILDSPLH